MIRLDRLSDNAQGALWILASVAGATAMTVAIRLLTPDLHTTMLAFLRSLFGVVFILPFLRSAATRRSTLRFQAWPLHLIRGGLIAIALNSGFFSIWKLPMATATLLFFTAPIWATIFAQFLLGERVGPRRWSAIAVGFFGAVIILRPGFSEIEPAMLLALLSSLAFAAALIIGKIAARRDGNEAVFVSSSVIVVFGALPPALFFWSIPVAPVVWAILVILVLSSVIRTYADIRAYSAGEAGFLAPFSYLRLLSVGVIGFVWFDEILDAPTIAGGAVIIGATLYISLREARLKRGPGKPETP